MVGIAAALVAVVVGIIIRFSVGLPGGNRPDDASREILNSFPFMFFVILLVTFLGKISARFCRYRDGIILAGYGAYRGTNAESQAQKSLLKLRKWVGYLPCASLSVILCRTCWRGGGVRFCCWCPA